MSVTLLVEIRRALMILVKALDAEINSRKSPDRAGTSDANG